MAGTAQHRKNVQNLCSRWTLHSSFLFNCQQQFFPGGWWQEISTQSSSFT
jgi:hypothetical protein